MMNRTLLYKFLLLLTIWAWFQSCQDNRPKPGEIVARVGDAYLTRETVLSLLPPELETHEREFMLKRIIDQWVDNQVLAQAAKREGLKISEVELWEIRNLQNELPATKFLKSRVPGSFPVTDQEIEDYYQTYQEQFRRDEDEVHLIHLYLEHLDRAIVKEIRSTKSLLEVIKKNYLDRQINRINEPNGDLGYVPVKSLQPKFQRAIRGKKTGVIYGPIKIEQGYHYLQVIDRQPAGSIRSLDLVQDEIISRLQLKKQQQFSEELLNRYRKDFRAETFYENVM